MTVVPALLRLRLPHHAGRAQAEAVALAAITIHVPASPELNVIPELSTGAGTAHVWTYSLLLRAATLRAPVDPNHVVQAAGHAADQALHAEYGIEAGASAVLARTAEQLATCRRAAIGAPTYPGRR
ncbi:hypothetical protein LWC33_33895 [Pseudonocardia sp. RS11V-5]|uniref:hypothetical protein n=1 Tax=Pseudonocardia terrae TaxID=2905831 RepID=UPI001E303F03|nr:hypothetical protein [Pseudonocardia terrae]MCE3556420.1 hypothetical protein [Pseudonocardia terrae]